MSDVRPAGVVVDTMVISWLLEDRADQLTDQYRALIDTSRVLLAFQTVIELRYGALRAGWGDLRRRRLERRIAELVVRQPDDTMIAVCAELRLDCRRLGHPLAGKPHDGDRWIAAAAIRLRAPLVSDDRIFRAAPRLELLTVDGEH